MSAQEVCRWVENVTAVTGYLPSRSGDGYSYGGGTMLTLSGSYRTKWDKGVPAPFSISLFLGEGDLAIHLADYVAAALKARAASGGME